MISPAPRGEFVRLETKGRRSGLPHIVELRFACFDGAFFFLSGSEKSDWVLNALDSGKGKVRSDDSVFESTARLATESERRVVMWEFDRKYGKRLVDGWYGQPAACLCFAPVGPPKLRRATSGESNSRTTYAQWLGNRGNYYEDVGSAFDSASEEYDFTISHNFINTWIRSRSISLLLDYLRPKDLLLEIGCGTGAETIEISKHVSGIIAMDISQKMVDLIAAKAKARHLSNKITTAKLAAAEISDAQRYLDGRRVRVAYSFNGALNCEPNLGRFVTGLNSLLEPHGYFICSIRNTICLSEMLSHALTLQFDKATPRKKQPAMVSVGGTDIPSTYYPALQFAEFFRPWFRAVKKVGLPALIPPAYLNSYYVRARRGLPLVEKLEPLISSKFPFNQLGDQTLFVFQKVSG